MICLHKKWEHLEKPDEEGVSKCRCMKCGKIKYRKLPVDKNGRHCYIWCDICNNDLIRESYIGDFEDTVSGITVSVYMCNKCRAISLWSFDIAFAPVLLESSATGNYDKYLKIVEEIKNKNKDGK